MVLFLFLYIISMLIIRMNIFLQIICEFYAYLFTITAYKVHYNHRHERVESLDPRTLPPKPSRCSWIFRLRLGRPMSRRPMV
jgi:hypothetical protein